ncbi:primosomal replication protein N [Methyloversatilis thermotolerans]|uniref:primosomal replication protein N n=1 Tax=Methyloversatilis thermotolerans TaxID=1346290 RepID=UPI00036B3E35|nr:primosomal replication protein N [Methyloversatilis thermotolerans]
MTEEQGAIGPAANSFKLAATLIECDALRLTPAGVPVLKGCLEHRSLQTENGMQREVRFETDFVLLGDQARLLAQAPLGTSLIASGFMAARSARSRQGVMHITSIEFVASGG